jgi:hypothetical protein
MRPPRRPLTAALALAVVVLAACSSGAGGGGAGVPAPPAAEASSDLAGVCPDPVVVQTNWFPQSEHGAVYQLLGHGSTIDAGRRRATGPLLADGKPTGVRLEIRAGGPAVSFQSSGSLLYQDPQITLGMLQADEIIQLYKTQPVVGVVAPLELDPQVLLWDPQRHPDWNIIADIGQTNAKVLYFQANTYMEYLVGSGILRRSQVDGSYDGSPSAFVASGGQIAVQGYATNEPYTYEHEITQWRRPMKYQLIYDTGYPNYGNVLAVRTDKKDALAPCLKRLVPMLQRAQVAFIANPEPVIKTILTANDAYKGSFVYTNGNARFAVEQLRRIGIVDNGPDRTLGNFDQGRLKRLIDIVGPILAAAKKPIKPGLEPEEVGTNEFIDPHVRLP